MATQILIDNNEITKEVELMVSQNKSRKAPPRYDEKVKKQIVDAAKSGMSLREILEKFEPRKRAVLRYLKKYDIKLQH
ncbi:MAG TPA: hypothetical protein VJ438_02130 [Candidatus Nanoarchaeia archaeon]|nr:hypothetical protein [Candidatus Nanoarchaeia archaeon]